VIQMGARESMQLIEKDVVDLIQRWLITEEEWLKYANNPKVVKEALNN
jgi:Tfp pilus assembly pilus retraction ATPase PilT